METFYYNLIKEIYNKYNKEKSSDIPRLLEKYKGKEKELILSLFKKYSGNPLDLDFFKKYLARNFKEYLTAFYSKFNPEKLNEVANLVEKYKDQKEAIIRQLCSKYDIETFSLVEFIDFRNIEIDSTGSYEEIEIPERRKTIETDQSISKKANSVTPPKKKVNGYLVIAIVLIILSGGIIFRLYFYNIHTDTTQTSQAISKETSSGQVNSGKEHQLQISSVTASSFMPSTRNLTFSPQNTIDDDLQTWWTPAPPHSDGTNSWLRFGFTGMLKVDAIEILNGSHYLNYSIYGDLYMKNNRLLKATLEFSNGNSQTIELKDVDKIQRISISPQNTNFIKLIPLEWAKGSTWNDLCISDFKVFAFTGENSEVSTENTWMLILGSFRTKEEAINFKTQFDKGHQINTEILNTNDFTRLTKDLYIVVTKKDLTSSDAQKSLEEIKALSIDGYIKDAGQNIGNNEVSKSSGSDCEKYLKEYEKFVMDYIEIIKKYKKNPTDNSILSDYTRMVSEANDWTTKIQDCQNDPTLFQKYTELTQKIATAASEAN